MSLRQIVGPELLKVLDVVGDEDDSVVVKVEISSGDVLDPVPPVWHEFLFRVVDGEWQESSHRERRGAPAKP